MKTNTKTPTTKTTKLTPIMELLEVEDDLSFWDTPDTYTLHLPKDQLARLGLK